MENINDNANDHRANIRKQQEGSAKPQRQRLNAIGTGSGTGMRMGTVLVPPEERRAACGSWLGQVIDEFRLLWLAESRLSLLPDLRGIVGVRDFPSQWRRIIVRSSVFMPGCFPTLLSTDLNDDDLPPPPTLYCYECGASFRAKRVLVGHMTLHAYRTESLVAVTATTATSPSSICMRYHASIRCKTCPRCARCS